MVTGAYKPRNPKASALYQCVQAHFAEFEAAYPTRYQEQYGFYRPVIGRVVQKVLTCGDLTKGFARIRCDTCRHEYLVAFSCKGRDFCPSCHQKRVLQFGVWVAEEVLAPVPHRQYVFTPPKMLRIYFRKDRRLLGKLSQCAADALKTLFRAAGKDPKAVPGIIMVIQTYGDLVNFHPHLHALVTDGVFTPTGWFVAFPKSDLYALEYLFRHRVLRLLLRERRIDESVIRKLLGWRHSGFSLHNAVRIGAADLDGRRGVAEYILRSPFSLEKMRYQANTGTIICQSKMHPVLKRNFEVFSACDWLAALTAHIPNAGEHLVRCYGWYSNVNRGKRRKTEEKGEASAPIEASSEVSDSAATRAWARLIKQVYEVDPLACPRCAGSMRIIVFIEQPAVIEKILRHLALWPAPAHSPPVQSIAAYATLQSAGTTEPQIGWDGAVRSGVGSGDSAVCPRFPLDTRHRYVEYSSAADAISGGGRQVPRGCGRPDSPITITCYAKTRRPFGCGIGRPSEVAVSIHSPITTSALAIASW